MVEFRDSLRREGHVEGLLLADVAPGAGRFVAPAWLVALVGAAVVVAGIFYFVFRAVRARRQGRFSYPPAKRG